MTTMQMRLLQTTLKSLQAKELANVQENLHKRLTRHGYEITYHLPDNKVSSVLTPGNQENPTPLICLVLNNP